MTDALPLIRAAIFDLDDTLYDCLHQRVEVAHRHAAEAAVRAGVKATVEEVLAVRMKAFLADPQLRNIDAAVAKAFAIDHAEEVSRAAHAAYFSCPVGKLTLFPQSLHVLRTLHERGVRNFIVSYGEPETQRQKATSLGLIGEASVERIFFADRQKRLTKEMAFREIQQLTSFLPQEIMVVGDRVSGEIAAANTLGMHSVRKKGGEFAALNPMSAIEEPQFEVENIEDVLKLPFRFGSS